MADLKNSTLDDISGVIGFSATIRLAAHYGGRDIHVPREVSELHPLVKLLGISRVTRLSAEWAGQRVVVPSLGFCDTEVRNAKILSLLIHDLHVDHVANILGITVRRVEQLRKEFTDEGLLPEYSGKKPSRNSQAKLELEIGAENS